uniref:Insulin-like domain-containing protein n=1 Tax=Panagrolaimus sp. ES5 TaxID=591445 RepID=A0AC34FEY4_9BILA
MRTSIFTITSFILFLAAACAVVAAKKYCGTELDRMVAKTCVFPGETQPCLGSSAMTNSNVQQECCQKGCDLKTIQKLCCFTEKFKFQFFISIFFFYAFLIFNIRTINRNCFYLLLIKINDSTITSPDLSRMNTEYSWTPRQLFTFVFYFVAQHGKYSLGYAHLGVLACFFLL